MRTGRQKAPRNRGFLPINPRKEVIEVKRPTRGLFKRRRLKRLAARIILALVLFFGKCNPLN
jgi:hypothetical protein